jgi:hypothetical protein
LGVGIFNSPGQASAYSTPGTPDYMFVAAGGSNVESFGFEGSVNLTNQQIRINALTAPNTFTSGVAANSAFSFVNNRVYNFVEQYSGDATRQVNISVTDTTTNQVFTIATYTALYGGIQSLIIRQRTPQNGTTTSSSVTMQNLSIAGTTFPDVITLTSSSSLALANYFYITGIDFTKPWTLTGSFTAAWTGTAPSANQLSFQIKGWENPMVPEPSSFVLLGLGLLIIGLVSRRARGPAGPLPSR